MQIQRSINNINIAQLRVYTGNIEHNKKKKDGMLDRGAEHQDHYCGSHLNRLS